MIGEADALIVTAGAGMGVDSGLPDFRGNQGFWRAYPALAEAGLEFTRIASPRAFREDPALAWGFYGHRLALYRATVPHEGFGLLQRWGERMARGCRVFTSNVDGHFQRAGFAEDQVYECHGSIHHLQCLDGCSADIWSAEGFSPEVDARACRLKNAPPVCPRCGGMARPNILMFGDGDWVAARAEEQARGLERWLQGVQRGVAIELGAGTAIPSVRHFGERLVSSGRARMIRINPREAQAPRGQAGLAMGALAGLMAIDAELMLS